MAGETEPSELTEAVRGLLGLLRGVSASTEGELAAVKEELNAFKGELALVKEELTECKQELARLKEELAECKRELGTTKGWQWVEDLRLNLEHLMLNVEQRFQQSTGNCKTMWERFKIVAQNAIIGHVSTMATSGKIVIPSADVKPWDEKEREVSIQGIQYNGKK